MEDLRLASFRIMTLNHWYDGIWSDTNLYICMWYRWKINRCELVNFPPEISIYIGDLRLVDFKVITCNCWDDGTWGAITLFRLTFTVLLITIVPPYALEYIHLTHCGWDKMATISQATFSNAFSCMKMFEFRLIFHRSLFLRFELTIFHHWFR